MPQFTLRHLFLLTSFLCLWFGIYVNWPNLLVLALPFYMALAGLSVYLVRSAEDQATRLERFGLLTGLNLICGYAAYYSLNVVTLVSFYWAVLAFLVEVFLQGMYVCIQCVRENPDELNAWTLMKLGAYFIANFITAAMMLVSLVNQFLSVG